MFTGGHGMSDDHRLKTAAMLSELWDGKPIKRVRALDGITILPGRRLSMHVLIQPDATGAFLSSGTLRDHGLLSRVLLAHPESMAGARFYRGPRQDDLDAIKAYGARLLSILEASRALAPGKCNELDPPALPLSPDAAAAWKAFHDHVESQCGKDGELAATRDFAGKAAEHAARIAGVLTIVHDLRAKDIDATAMRRALEIADWYVAEAARLQQAGMINPRLRRAASLLEWLHSQPRAEANFREILRSGPSQTRLKANAEDALAILAAHGWIVEISERPRVIRAFAAEAGA
jgi:Protein of unknown function (DUF3987)